MSERERVCLLVKQAQEGDNEAMGQLFALYKDRCYFVAFKILRDRESAEDVVQETAILVVQNLQTLRKPEKFFSWAMRISNNVALRKAGRRREVPLTPPDETEGAAAEPADPDPDARPEEALDQRETSRIIAGLVDDLPQEQRFCAYMFYYEELSVAQIAQTLQVSENTVKSRLRYAREKLRAGVREVERQGVRLHIFPLPFRIIRRALQNCADRYTLAPDRSDAILRGALGASVAAGGAKAAVGAEILAAAALSSGAHALLTGAGLSAAAKAGIAAAVGLGVGGLMVGQIAVASALPVAQPSPAPSTQAGYMSSRVRADSAPRQTGVSALEEEKTAASSSRTASSSKASSKVASSSKSSSASKAISSSSAVQQTQSAPQAQAAAAKYYCTECGAGRQYPNQSCPACGAHQSADPNILHYHGDGYKNGICPSCGLEYHAVTQEQLDWGVVPGSTLSEEYGYAPDGSLMPGWVMSEVWGHPVREEDYAPAPTTFDDGCPLSQHLHTGSCNDRYVDGCWGGAHTYTGSCMFAPASEPEVTQPEPEVTEPTPEVTEPAPEVTEPAPEVTQPEPEVTEPTSEVTEPEPEVTESAPEVTEPAPEVTEPAPEAAEPAAEGGQPAAEG